MIADVTCIHAPVYLNKRTCANMSCCMWYVGLYANNIKQWYVCTTLHAHIYTARNHYPVGGTLCCDSQRPGRARHPILFRSSLWHSKNTWKNCWKDLEWNWFHLRFLRHPRSNEMLEEIKTLEVPPQWPAGHFRHPMTCPFLGMIFLFTSWNTESSIIHLWKIHLLDVFRSFFNKSIQL